MYILEIIPQTFSIYSSYRYGNSNFYMDQSFTNL